ncbi:MAG: dTDP-4-dehydrorhamnose 3,5-epimerase [Pseudomonadota bacterium]|nr:dTDP-4-dehydrorhamnose 3,5-epimerase [Pseudomonadota bacterium]
MKLENTKFDDAFILEPNIHKDSRGYFYESYNQEIFSDKVKKPINFVQDNHSLSNKNVLRGLHYQKPPFEQAKLVRVISGAIYDVIVDIRRESHNFGIWQSFILSSENNLQLWIPRGFAHGFLSLEENTQVIYKTDNFYNKEASISIMHNDIDLQIEWPVNNPILSPNDKNGIKFSEL